MYLGYCVSFTKVNINDRTKNFKRLKWYYKVLLKSCWDVKQGTKLIASFNLWRPYFVVRKISYTISCCISCLFSRLFLFEIGSTNTIYHDWQLEFIYFWSTTTVQLCAKIMPAVLSCMPLIFTEIFHWLKQILKSNRSSWFS